MATNIYNVRYHGETGRIVGPSMSASVSAAAQDYDTILAVLSNNGLLPQGTLVIDAVKADPSGSQTVLTPPTGLITYKLVATQVGATMNYALTSNDPHFPLTSSFSMPVNPVPSDVGSPVVGADQIGFSFQSYPPSNYLFDGSPHPGTTIIFYNLNAAPPTFAGGLAAASSGSTIDYLLTGPQLYSGSEANPTMLAGTFTLTLIDLSPSSPNVYKVNYHFEKNGRRSIVDLCDYVTAPSQNYDDIAAVLISNGLMKPGVLVIDGVQIYNQAIFT